MLLQRKYFIIFLIQVTEVLGFSLILPFLPFYAQQFGASPIVVGLILTSFSFFQFVSAPIMGRLSDLYGRKPLLIASQISTGLSFLILGWASALWMVFASRIIDGLLGSNMTIAQAYLSDISTEKERSKAFGLSGIAFGFGFLFGPAIGGYLSQFGYGLPSFIAAFLSFITILITILFLPETVDKKQKFSLQIKIIDVEAFKKYFSDKVLLPKFVLFGTYILAHVTWVSSFALYAERQLHYNASHIGYLLAYVGFISIMFRGVLLGKLIDFFGEPKLIKLGVLAIFFGLLGAVFTNTTWMFVIVMTLFAVSSGLSRPLLLGNIS